MITIPGHTKNHRKNNAEQIGRTAPNSEVPFLERGTRRNRDGEEMGREGKMGGGEGKLWRGGKMGGRGKEKNGEGEGGIPVV